MGITHAHFVALVEDLAAALDKFNVPTAEKNELLGALAPLEPMIVTAARNARNYERRCRVSGGAGSSDTRHRLCFPDTAFVS